MSLLEVEELVKSYKIPGAKPVQVLKGISFSVSAGERLAVVGRSGAGKTTLLNIIGALDIPDSGDVRINGHSMFKGFFSASRAQRLRASSIGFVFQSYRLFPELDVLENVLLPVLSGRSGVSRKDAVERAMTLLDKVGLAERSNHLPAELSGGEQQRVALARALVCNPKLILADEPTGNLDDLTGADIMKLLVSLTDNEECALVMVTHSKEAAAVCSRTIRLDGGLITE